MSVPTNPTTFRPPVRPVGVSGSRNSIVGTVIIVAMLSSVLTSVATTFVITRYYPLSPPPKTVAATRSGPLPAIKRVVKPATPGDQPADAAVPPVDAANTALNLVQTVRDQGSSFVGPQAHTGLWADLLRLEAAATAVTNDDGTNAAKTTQLTTKFAAELDAAVKRADNIAKRASETPDSVTQATQMESLLSDIRSNLP